MPNFRCHSCGNVDHAVWCMYLDQHRILDEQHRDCLKGLTPEEFAFGATYWRGGR